MRQAKQAGPDSQTSSHQPSDNTQQVQSPAISLPKGGGAIRGMGEKFAANPVTGTGSMSVPIATSPGRSGFGPQLSLSYDSAAGNGPFGFGWNLSIPSITRKTDKGLPRYHDTEESDVFILSGAEDLVPEFKKDAAGEWQLEDGQHVIFDEPRIVDGVTYCVRRYRPRIEGLFARIERWTNAITGEIHWRSITRDNITTLYGQSNNSRIFDPDDSNPDHPTRIFSWLICESYDDKGNVIVYDYQAEDDRDVDQGQANERNRVRTTNRYLKHIYYGNHTPYFPLLAADTPRPTPPGPGNWLFEVVFDYDDHNLTNPKPKDHEEKNNKGEYKWPWKCRQDPFSSYRSGFEVRTYRLCQRALMFHHFPSEDNVGNDCLVRSTDFEYSYEQDPTSVRNPVYTFLCEVTQSGYKRDNGRYLKRSLPPVEFEYSQPIVQDTVKEVDPVSLENLPIGLDGTAYQWTDLHGEGIPGILTEQAGAWFYKRNLSPIGKHPVEFAPLENVAVKPNLTLANGAQFMDLAGDGRPDLVVLDGPTPGLYEHDGDQGWQSFRPFTARLNRNMRDPNLKFVDLNGDGHADALISEDDAFVWHPSLAEEGFGPAHRVAQVLDEEKGPRLVFADGAQSIYLADLSGDGLTDLARIRNDEVCYWPNLGYARFGAKVTMDNAPHFDNPDQFDHKRIRLADIDGSGTTDIIYLHRDGVCLYFNQSGNSWSQPQVLSVFPRVDDLVSIMPTDLLGNGTACLVWSSPLPGDATRPMRYVNLMGGQKPHLLVKTINNLGAETRVQYAPSTKFYLQDKQNGNPWITRLPFPVHVVERVTTLDRISRNRFVTRYAYHHGYYDGIEREFRGFGRVDQWDSEEYASLEASGELKDSTNWEIQTHVPPVLTKTWFHTGAYLQESAISRQLLKEYYQEGDSSLGEAGLAPAQQKAMLLDDTILPTSIMQAGGQRLAWNLSAEEQHEACRALKGAILRQEVYAEDKSEEADRPYTVSEQNYTIEMLQPEVSNRHAVFFTHPRETVEFHYERKLFSVVGDTLDNPQAPSPHAKMTADPRVSHAINLEVDSYGNALKSVAIGYGRRYKDPALSAADQQKQRQTLIIYTENNFTNAIDDLVANTDDYRAPLSSEVRTYELLNFQPSSAQPAITNLFKFDEVQQLIKSNNFSQGSWDIPYHDVTHQSAIGEHPYRRLVERARVHYRPNDMGAAVGDAQTLLPLHGLEPLALPGESYQLAFTPELIATIYQRKLKNQPLEQLLPPNSANLLGGTNKDEGGYVDLDGDGHWWIPSGRAYYHPDPNAIPQQERQTARQHFYLPRRFADPFQHNTTMAYEYDLLPIWTEDAVGNRVTAVNDYRVLQPRLTTDPNGNRTQVAFDALGMVAGTAVMGKPGEQKGDLIDAAFIPDLDEATILNHINAPFASNPHAILQKATTRLVYDLFAYRRTKDEPQPQPAVVYSLVRETHAVDLGSDQQTKIQHSFAYSDGFGREIQQKIQAEPEIINNIPGPPRWVGSGWTVFNNKGKPIRQYEPFFTATHHFEFDVRVGVSPVLFYDPVGRVIATLHPNHTYEKILFDPWQQTTYDINDTVAADPRTDSDIVGYVADYFQEIAPQENDWQTWLQERNVDPHNPPAITSQMDAEVRAAIQTLAHRDTPTVAHFDSLGRPFLTIADNGVDANNQPQKYETRVVLDIEGNQREVIDAKGRLVMRYHYNMAGPADEEEGDEEDEGRASNLIHQASMEAGERWLLNDIVGNPIRAWDSRGFMRRLTYDVLRRPLGLYVTVNGSERLAEQTVYGEGQGDTDNHRGQVYKLHDGTGIVTSVAYDFKGNLLKSKRDLLANYKETVNWSDNLVDNAGNIINSDGSFTTVTEYDALNRPLSVTSPDNSVNRPTYNEANLLDKVEVNLRGAKDPEPNGEPIWTIFVKNINYDAKGQRKKIEYGNGSQTKYTYDPYTFRLTHMKTTRPPGRNGLPAQIFKNPIVVQDLHYTYDLVGNITCIADAALKSVFNGNQEAKAENHYNYDPIYRLIQATGREHIGQTGFDFNPPNGNYRDHPFKGQHAHTNNLQAIRKYTQTYQYDPVGNFKKMKHQANGGNWTRHYKYGEESLIEPDQKSNRLTKTELGNGHDRTEKYTHDVHGNMTSMLHLTEMVWDFEDQLQKVALSGGRTAYYVYDASGERLRKVIEGDDGQRDKERLYLGGYETYREFKSDGETVKLERETLHVMDDEQRIVLVETRTFAEGNKIATPNPRQRYQLGNHLGSASVELSFDSGLISYEEYHPYGTTSFQVYATVEVTLKRYRYTGKERDRESGLAYHRARYYAPWLGRWGRMDPETLEFKGDQYVYASNNPIIYSDLDGKRSRRVNVQIDIMLSTNPVLRDPHLRATARRIASREWGYSPSKSNDNLLANEHWNLVHSLRIGAYRGFSKAITKHLDKSALLTYLRGRKRSFIVRNIARKITGKMIASKLILPLSYASEILRSSRTGGIGNEPLDHLAWGTERKLVQDLMKKAKTGQISSGQYSVFSSKIGAWHNILVTKQPDNLYEPFVQRWFVKPKTPILPPIDEWSRIKKYQPSKLKEVVQKWLIKKKAFEAFHGMRSGGISN